VVALRVLSRTNLAESFPSTSFTSSISFTSFRLPPLCISLPSFFNSRPLFPTTSSLFFQNTGVGIPNASTGCRGVGWASRMQLRDTRDADTESATSNLPAEADLFSLVSASAQRPLRLRVIICLRFRPPFGRSLCCPCRRLPLLGRGGKSRSCASHLESTLVKVHQNK
jgi:hypothetical protein